jgi:hypothetical protein
MEFKDKYISEADNMELGNKDKKKIIGNDAYCIGEMIEVLVNKIEQARLSLR